MVSYKCWRDQVKKRIKPIRLQLLPHQLPRPSSPTPTTHKKDLVQSLLRRKLKGRSRISICLHGDFQRGLDHQLWMFKAILLNISMNFLKDSFFSCRILMKVRDVNWCGQLVTICVLVLVIKVSKLFVENGGSWVNQLSATLFKDVEKTRHSWHRSKYISLYIKHAHKGHLFHRISLYLGSSNVGMGGLDIHYPFHKRVSVCTSLCQWGVFRSVKLWFHFQRLGFGNRRCFGSLWHCYIFSHWL